MTTADAGAPNERLAPLGTERHPDPGREQGSDAVNTDTRTDRERELEQWLDHDNVQQELFPVGCTVRLRLPLHERHGNNPDAPVMQFRHGDYRPAEYEVTAITPGYLFDTQWGTAGWGARYHLKDLSIPDDGYRLELPATRLLPAPSPAA